MSKKILVIEDEEPLLEEILGILTLEGFEATGALDGVVGVDMAREILPDLIISDIMMPRMSGYDVLNTLSLDLATAEIPFIFLTAKTRHADLRRAMVLGADDYLTKPFSSRELLMIIQTRLEKHAIITKRYVQQMDDLQRAINLSLPHELRTPLMLIMGYADFMLNDLDGFTMKRIRSMLEAIKGAGERLHRMTENYLLYTQLTLGDMPESQRRMLQGVHQDNPIVIITQTARMVADKAGRPDDLLLDIENVPVMITEDGLKKIVSELVDNAFKFSQKGNRVLVSSELHEGKYALEIQDQGVGMTRDEIKSIGAYVQFDRKTKEQQGIGLGLFLVRKLAELYQGQLLISSQPDVGTLMRVDLTLFQEDMENIASEEPSLALVG